MKTNIFRTSSFYFLVATITLLIFGIWFFSNSDSGNAITGQVIKSSLEKNLENSEWIETLQLKELNYQRGEPFGSSVDIDENRMIVGAEGFAYVYHKEGDKLIEYRLVNSDLAVEESFGFNVAIDGDTVAVSAHRSNDQGSNTGSVYVFRWNGIGWYEVAKLLPSDGESWDYFGSSLALFDNTIMVGSLDDDLGENSGSVYVYEYIEYDKGEENWVEITKLTASDGFSHDFFGINRNIDLLGDLAIIGARGHEEGSMSNIEIGAAYVFRKNNGKWEEEQRLIASDGDFNDQFSRNAVAISNDGNRIIVGAFNRGSSGILDGFGVAYVFRHDSVIEQWEEEQRLIASDGKYGDSYGFVVDIYGETAVVGAPQIYGDGEKNSGAVYVYKLEKSEWLEKQKIEGKSEGFGSVVSLYGENVLIGDSLGDAWIYNNCAGGINCHTIKFNSKSVINLPPEQISPEILEEKLPEKKLQLNIDQEKLNSENSLWSFNNKLQLPSDSYNAFGQLIRTDDSLIYISRIAQTHHLSGKIAKWAYIPAEKKWNTGRVIYDSEFDDRGGKGGIINGKIYIFITRRERTQTIDIGYIVSEDGGKTWSDFNKIKLNSELISFASYGHIVESNVEGLYYMPYYGITKDDRWILKLLLSKNFGETWEDGPVMHTSEIESGFAEGVVEHIGDGKMIALIRKGDAAGGKIRQITSSDNGLTWSEMKETNLGEDYGTKIPFTYYDKEIDKIIAIYMDRRKNEEPDDVLKISIGDAQAVFANPMKWGKSYVIDNNYFSNCCGYPSLVKVSENFYYFMHSKEINKGKAEPWGGYIYLK